MSDTESLQFHELLEMAINDSPEPYKNELRNYINYFITYRIMHRTIDDLHTLQSTLCEFRSVLKTKLPVVTFMKFVSMENEIYTHIFNIFEKFI